MEGMWSEGRSLSKEFGVSDLCHNISFSIDSLFCESKESIHVFMDDDGEIEVLDNVELGE